MRLGETLAAARVTGKSKRVTAAEILQWRARVAAPNLQLGDRERSREMRVA